MSKHCRQCNKCLPNTWLTNICLECSRENAGKIFKEDPQLKQAFKESIEEMRKPENVKKMAEETCKVMNSVLEIQKSVKEQKAGSVYEKN